MSSAESNHSPKYRIEHSASEPAKSRLDGDSFSQPDSQTPVMATVKVAQEGYVPPGIEVRTWIGPSIFTANIPAKAMAALEQDPQVLAIEPNRDLRSY